jgi:hypothetical protein
MENPMIIAAVATTITIVAYNLAGRIGNRLLRGLAQLASVFGAMAVAALMAPSPEAGSTVGQYYLVGILAVVIAGKLFGKSRKDS